MSLRRSIWLLNTLLLAVIGYLAADILLPASGEKRPLGYPPSDPPPSDPPPVRVTMEDMAPVLHRDLFGARGSVPTDAPTPALGGQTAAQSVLRLRLLGTIAGDPAFARAVIEDGGTKAQDLYRVGDEVQGARIESIEASRVILVRLGNREALNLVVGPGETGPSPVAAVPAPALVADPGDAVRVLSPTEFDVNRRAFLAKIGGFSDILNVARLTPVEENGVAQGLRVTGIDQISMARFVGLQEGDIIRTVNGQLLTSPQKAFQVFRKARTQDAVTVDLRRGDEDRTLSFSFR